MQTFDRSWMDVGPIEESEGPQLPLYSVSSDMETLLQGSREALNLQETSGPYAAMKALAADAQRGSSWSLTAALWLALQHDQVLWGDALFARAYPSCRTLASRALDTSGFPGSLRYCYSDESVFAAVVLPDGSTRSIDNYPYGQQAAQFVMSLITAISNYSLMQLVLRNDCSQSIENWTRLSRLGFYRGTIYAALASQLSESAEDWSTRLASIPCEALPAIQGYLEEYAEQDGWLGMWFRECQRLMGWDSAPARNDSSAPAVPGHRQEATFVATHWVVAEQEIQHESDFGGFDFFG